MNSRDFRQRLQPRFHIVATINLDFGMVLAIELSNRFLMDRLRRKLNACCIPVLSYFGLSSPGCQSLVIFWAQQSGLSESRRLCFLRPRVPLGGRAFGVQIYRRLRVVLSASFPVWMEFRSIVASVSSYPVWMEGPQPGGWGSLFLPNPVHIRHGFETTAQLQTPDRSTPAGIVRANKTFGAG